MQGRIIEKYYFGNTIEHQRWETLYQTREELKAAEERGEGRINWDIWDKKVNEMKEFLENSLQHYKTCTKRNKTKRTKTREVWAYNFNGELIGHYVSLKNAAETYNVRSGTIQNTITEQRPLHYLKLIFSYRPLKKKEVLEIVKNNAHASTTKNKPKWVYSMRGKFLGYFNNSFQVAEKFNMTANQVNYQAWINKPYKKLGIIISNQPIEWQEEENQ